MKLDKQTRRGKGKSKEKQMQEATARKKSNTAEERMSGCSGCGRKRSGEFVGVFIAFGAGPELCNSETPHLPGNPHSCTEYAVPFCTSKMAFMYMCHRLTLMYVLRTYVQSIHTAYIRCTE